MVQPAVKFSAGSGSIGKQSLLPEEMDHGDPTQTSAKTPKELSAVNQTSIFSTQERNRRLL
jgi:hypothetical protein